MKLRIKEHRKNAGLTQKALAGRIGMSQSYFAQIETGERPLKASVQAKIAEALKVHPGDLIDFDAPDEDEHEELIRLYAELEPAERKLVRSVILSFLSAEEAGASGEG